MGFDVAMWLGRINARRLSVVVVVGQPNGTNGMHSGIYELDCVEGVFVFFWFWLLSVA